jgi:hypothetical protein
MSVSAAALAAAVAGSAAAAAVSGASKPAPKPAVSGKKAVKHDAPKLSKWQLHEQAMLKVSAPGDEYFGRMKMSYLGINNTFRDDLIRAGSYTTDPKLIGQIHWADDALLAWADKYPNDPQLARSYFLAFQMYRKIWVQEYQQKAFEYANIVIKKWPKSFFGKALKKDLSIGYTEHYFATPVPCESLATAVPSGSPNPHATATPTPEPTPTPTPTPTAAPGQPKTDILPVPCSTPTPTPTPVPSLTPAASPSPGATPAPIRTMIPRPLPTGSLTPSPLPSASTAPTVSPSPTPTRRP